MQLPLKTLLVDDEPLAVARLRRLLVPHVDTFDIVGEAGNGAEGLAFIEAEQPDVVFLDIEMPLLNGFEMLDKLTTMPMVIFATAYDRYAIRAFEENSVDYLLKPIEAERLSRTAQKIRSLVERDGPDSRSNPMSDSLLQLLAQMKPKKEIHSLSVKTGDKIVLIPLNDIACFEAEDKYVFLCTTDGQKHLTNHTLTTLTEKLPDTFLRVSRSVIVNRFKITEMHRHFDGKYLLVLSDKKATKITTGSTYADTIRQLLEL